MLWSKEKCALHLSWPTGRPILGMTSPDFSLYGKQQSPYFAPLALSQMLSGMAARVDFPAIEQLALSQAATEARSKAKRKAQAILELPANATANEVSRARGTRAVRRGKDVFLPAWSDLHSALPNLLLRSGLWNVRATRHDFCIGECEGDGMHAEPVCIDNHVVPSLGDVTLINRGPALGSFDRQVFAACINYYREDRPLSGGGDAAWIEVSFFKFITGRGSSYHADGHRALRASLERLSAMSLHVRHDGQEIQLPRVIEVSFSDGTARGDAPQASDSIFFRVLAPFAALYGPNKWTAVPHDALNAGMGLKSWLACFYSTHSKSFPTKIEDIHYLCKSAASLPKFKVQLRDALKIMSSNAQPLSTRVASFDIRAKTVTVQMASWPQSDRRTSAVESAAEG